MHIYAEKNFEPIEIGSLLSLVALSFHTRLGRCDLQPKFDRFCVGKMCDMWLA